jgi:hypothetical protein
MLLVATLFIPGTLSLFDLSRFRGIFMTEFQFMPFAFVKSLGIELGFLAWQTEIFIIYLLFALMFIVAFVHQMRYRYFDRSLFGQLLWVCFALSIPFYDLTTNSMGYRLYAIFLVFSPLLLLLLANFQRKIILYLLLFILVLTGINKNPADFTKFDPPYAHYQKLSTLVMENKEVMKHAKLFIAQKSLAEMLGFMSKKDSMSWKADEDMDITFVWRVSHGFKKQDFQRLLSAEDLTQVFPLGIYYALIREDVYQQMVKIIHAKEEDELKKIVASWENPYLQRPRYMMEKRKK